jgi:putative AdoMet-dependent methyltransferase
MLRHAAARARPGSPQPEWQEAGFLSWNTAPASLDLVTSKYALHHLPDFWKGLALVRIAEALRPGGRFYLEDVVFPCVPAEAPVLVEDWAQFLSSRGGYTRADAATHIREEHSTYGWVLEGLVERSGFRLLQASYSEGVYGAYLAERL